jgi:hypothetical protein
VKFEVLIKNTILFGVMSQLCGCLYTIVPEYSPAITCTFVISSVIVVAISHILSAVYLKSNESSGSTSGCYGGIFIKKHNFQWSHNSTKDANMVAFGK